MSIAEPPTEATATDSSGLLASEMNYDKRGVVWRSEETVPVAVEVPGLTLAVSSALAAAGYTELMTGSPLEGQLSPAVVQVLTAEDAVLVIESGGEE
ncbi:MAG: hypothetical protein ABFS21_02690 [Actinomycetota bacterium]